MVIVKVYWQIPEGILFLATRQDLLHSVINFGWRQWAKLAADAIHLHYNRLGVIDLNSVTICWRSVSWEQLQGYKCLQKKNL